MAKLIGAYLSPKTVADDPQYMDLAQKKLGLNMVIIDSQIKVSKETAAMNPFQPGSDVDDSVTLRAIKEARKRGMEIWLLFNGWHRHINEDHLALEAQTLDGRSYLKTPRPQYALESATVVCPSHLQFEEWQCRVLAEAAANYDVDVMDMTHARYVSPAIPHSLFGCGCRRCAKRAKELGYDFEQMKAGVLKFLDSIRSIDRKRIRELLKLNLSPIELITAFPGAEELPRWFKFRSKLIADNLAKRHDSVYKAGKGKVRFGVDNHIPSFALLAGHDYNEIVRVNDFTQPLLTWLEWHMLTVPAAWAWTLCQQVKGLTEGEALRFAYRLVGYDGFGLPETFDGLKVGSPDCEESCTALYNIIDSELTKSRLYNSGEKPSYAVLKGSVWPKEVIERLVARAEELGHDGWIYNAGTAALIDYKPIS